MNIISKCALGLFLSTSAFAAVVHEGMFVTNGQTFYGVYKYFGVGYQEPGACHITTTVFSGYIEVCDRCTYSYDESFLVNLNGGLGYNCAREEYTVPGHATKVVEYQLQNNGVQYLPTIPYFQVVELG